REEARAAGASAQSERRRSDVDRERKLEPTFPPISVGREATDKNNKKSGRPKPPNSSWKPIGTPPVSGVWGDRKVPPPFSERHLDRRAEQARVLALRDLPVVLIRLLLIGVEDRAARVVEGARRRHAVRVTSGLGRRVAHILQRLLLPVEQVEQEDLRS